MGNDFFVLIDFFVPAIGLYALYAAYVLKKDGRIIETFLLYKGANASDCKDIQGYANYMAPKLSAVGTLMIVYGAIALLNDYALDITGLFLVMVVVFIAALVWYSIAAKKALKMFF